MIKVNVVRTNGNTAEGTFESQEEANAWIDLNMQNNSWGPPGEFEVSTVDLGNGPKMDMIRAERNRRLSECDWTVLSDAPLSTSEKNAWKAYRTALRDLPELSDLNVDAPQWPEEP